MTFYFAARDSYPSVGPSPGVLSGIPFIWHAYHRGPRPSRTLEAARPPIAGPEVPHRPVRAALLHAADPHSPGWAALPRSVDGSNHVLSAPQRPRSTKWAMTHHEVRAVNVIGATLYMPSSPGLAEPLVGSRAFEAEGRRHPKARSADGEDGER